MRLSLEQTVGGIGDRGRRLQGCLVSVACWDRLIWMSFERWTQPGWRTRRRAMRTNVTTSKSPRACLPLIRRQPGERARFLWRGLIPALSRTGRPTGVLGGDTGESRVTGTT